MSNVVPIGLPRRPNLSQRQAALLQSFAKYRRSTDDVYWLKENAEILNILATSRAVLPTQAIETHREFYETSEERLRFFPQYYRFILSICLDLEDLGLDGGKGQFLCERVQRSGLAEGELSDLQRAEARRLLARRGGTGQDAQLSDRLTRFICRADTFAVPNKKAAYELTHIVFYLSEYGARKITLPERAVTSLEFAGVLAYLDQDIDLLSEICVALRFAGETPSDIWEDWLACELACFVLTPAMAGPMQDAYHEYLATSWWAQLAGLTGFPGQPATGATEIRRNGAERGPLRAISQVMYQLGSGRSSDWSQMRAVLEKSLPQDLNHILVSAAESSTQFGRFFAGFSRA